MKEARMQIKDCLLALAKAGVLSGALAGCAAPYVPAKGEAVASIHTVGLGRLSMCRGAERYSLWGQDRVVQVPVGTPIVVSSHMTSDGGNVTWHCSSSLEFVPEAGRTYVINDGFVSANRCFSELVRHDPATPTGLAVEPTLKRGVCAK